MLILFTLTLVHLLIDAFSGRDLHLCFFQMSLDSSVTNVYRGYSKLLSEKGPTADVPLLKQPTCCKLTAAGLLPGLSIWVILQLILLAM